ncbi:MAG: glycosyl hydrolase 53 family protein, partial [Gammaproteobacteria bacterium]|nr:glycosyl hydrolase 53 family protein [Gammaproteobacteria bacterium]
TSSESLYVKKVEGLSDDFIMGMDASCVPALEKSGVKYYSFDGKEQDVYKTLAEAGVNYIRVRIWNDPFDKDSNGYGGGNCDINNAIEVGKRATKYGMKLLVNFHYSDFWADPAKQMVPKAWKDMDVKTKAEALYEYTKECLKKLVDEGIDVGMVQIGNETNGKMCGESKWKQITDLMKAGSKAVREVTPNALVAVHFANPEKVTNYKDYSFQLKYFGVDYDVFGSSYYPYWHGTLENLSTVLGEIATKYNKKVMVLETSYAFTNDDTDFNGNTISDGGAIVKDYPFTINGQANSVRNIIDTVKGIKNGIGICYWEGTWISVGTTSWEENSAKWERYGSGWASSYAAEYDPNDAGKYYGGNAVDNQAFFDATGHPLESLKVFNLVRTGNEIATKVDSTQDINMIIDLNGEIVLPPTTNAVLTDDSKQSMPVVWEKLNKVNSDTTSTEVVGNAGQDAIDYMKTHGPQRYQVVGNVSGMVAYCYITMVEFNYVENWSFEDNSTGSPWVKQELNGKKANELYVEDKATDSLTGTKHYHFWASGTDAVEFVISQTITTATAGKYKFTISIMGGDAGTQEVYAYVKVNGVEVVRKVGNITTYGNWDTMVTDTFEYDGTSSLEVGIYVKCGGAGNGAWGKIDDAMLNSVSDAE